MGLTCVRRGPQGGGRGGREARRDGVYERGGAEKKGEGTAGAHAEGRRSGQAAHLEADGARAHASREPSEEKIEPATDSNPPSSQPSLELEVEGLGKDSDETKKRTLPRVRFA